LKTDGLYPATQAVDYSQFGGAVPANYSLSLTSPTSGTVIYYTTDGSDPRVTQERPTPIALAASNASTRYKVTTSLTDGFTANAGGSEPTPGPIGRWQLDGNLTDTGSGAATNGTPTAVGAPTYVTPGATGTGQALALSGTGQYINLGNPTNLQITGQITLSAWIKPTVIPAAQANIINKGHNLTPNGEITLRLDSSVNLTVGTWNGTNYATSAANVVQLNQWQHVCGLYDGTAWRLYRNGVQVSSFTTAQGAASVAGATAANNVWSIGSRGGASERLFNGQIDDVRIYNRGLNPTEVQNLYLGNVPTYTPDWKAAAYTVPVDWGTGNGGFGYDTNGGVDYTPFISTSLTMQGVSPSLLTRTQFSTTTAQISSLNLLQFNVRYDDGFIAYLNGTEIAKRNAPTNAASLHGLAVSTAVRTDTDAIVQEKIDLTNAGLPLLVNGTNVLAIQGLNTTAADADFLLQAELVAGDRTAYPTPTAQIYSTPLTLTSSATVKSRAWNPITGEWSALTESYFSVDTVPASASNIVVSEIHYHPANPITTAELAASTNPDDFEFVEVMNISPANKVEMTNVNFTSGLTYTFGHLVLAPGQRVVLVAHAAAFAARYGNSIVPVGTYVGQLANSGEHVLLNDALGGIIKDFQFNTDTTWPAAADGLGPSLSLINPTANPDHNVATNWRASLANGGSAGTSDATVYANWKSTNNITTDAADDDHDGLNALLEYAFGADPATPSLAQLPTATTETDGSITISFSPPPGTDDIAYTVETSSDLTLWQNPGTDLTYLGETNGVRSWKLNPGTTNRRFWHVTATLR
jgi:hypothetical protein